MSTDQYMNLCGKGFWPGDADWIHHNQFLFRPSRRGWRAGQPVPWWQIEGSLRRYEAEKERIRLREEEAVEVFDHPWQAAIFEFNEWLKIHKPNSPVFVPWEPYQLKKQMGAKAKVMKNRRSELITSKERLG